MASSFLSSGIQIDFDTDLSSTGIIRYGTSSGNLNFVQNTSTLDGFHQTATLTGLMIVTRYYYTVEGSTSGILSTVSPISSFYTLQVIDIANNSTGTTATGAIIFSGSLSTGGTIFPGTGTLSIGSENNSTDAIVLDFSGLTITPTGTWDGIFEAPKVVSLTGAMLSENGYTLTGSIYKAGNINTSLSLSGQSALVQITVGSGFNNTTLHVYRTDIGSVFTPIDTCIVSAGICQFQTNHFSYFAFGNPSDSVPNTFTFTNATSAELSTNTDSNIITLSGTNIPATISVSGGMYSINSLAFTSATGTILSGDTLQLRALSSASYATIANVTVNIGGVSTTFSVTTKAAPVVVSSGGGG